MSLGNKIIALFLVLGLSFSVGSYAALKLSIDPTFEAFERESTEQALSRVAMVLEAEMRALETMNIEYSSWDDTYDYAQGLMPEYAVDNLDPAYWHSIDINMMLVFDAQGNRLFGRIGHPEDGTELPMEQEFFQSLLPGHPLVTHESETSETKGIVETHYGLMQVVAYPILTSKSQGPIVGSLVVGQFLTGEHLVDVSKRSTVEMALYGVVGHDKLKTPNSTYAKVSNSDTGTYISNDEHLTRGYRFLLGINDAPGAILEVKMPRQIAAIGAQALKTTATLLVVATGIFLLAAWVFLQRLIVSPVRSLTERIFEIRNTGDLSLQLHTNRRDEIGSLANEFDGMTSNLNQVQIELEEARDTAVSTSRAKSEFLARMSHEIRTPMNGVLGMTELLRDTELTSKQQRFAETIYESAESLLEIINDILDFSKIEAGKLKPELLDVDLVAALEESVECLASQAQSKGLELINVVPTDMQRCVLGDRARLRQVLTNLIGNAIKFTERGEVVVRLTTDEVASDHVDARIEISDTGIGIKLEKQHLIFDSFAQEDGTTTRLYGGTGLGLAISRQLVELMGGHLEVTSTPGQGSTFHFTLRMKLGSEVIPVSAEQQQSIVGKRVLIVDDNATNREILTHQLGSWKASTDTASSADEATSILKAAADSEHLYDLAILDMHMPYRDGLDLAREIRANENLAALKLVMLSSVAAPATDEVLQQLDIAGQLTKPIRQSHLYDSLAVILAGISPGQRRLLEKPTVTAKLQGQILLAEDNPVNQAVAVGMLESVGIEVEVVGDGKQAVQALQKRRFDVVLMDCQMPVMDGFEATREIRRIERGGKGTPTPIVALTANALIGDRDRCLAAGMDEYLTKPFTSDQLRDLLSQFLVPAEDANGTKRIRDESRTGLNSQSSDCAATLDRNVLDGLIKLQSTGNPDLLTKVIGVYLESAKELKVKLSAAIDSGNSTEVREKAHALKSSSANVGARDLAEYCKALEMMGREDNLTDASTVFLQLEHEYKRVVVALNGEMMVATA